MKLIEAYLKATKQFKDYSDGNEPVFSQTVSLDLSTVVSSVSGPKRPNDRVSVSEMKDDFANCLRNKVWKYRDIALIIKIKPKISFTFNILSQF